MCRKGVNALFELRDVVDEPIACWDIIRNCVHLSGRPHAVDEPNDVAGFSLEKKSKNFLPVLHFHNLFYYVAF